MPVKKAVLILVCILPMVLSVIVSPFQIGSSSVAAISNEEDSDSPQTIELSDGTTLEVGPNEVLESFTLSLAPPSIQGIASELNVTEYGTRMDS
ncbi:MAG: hypothetical protein ACFFD3_07035, partial [Candidatus Thorarchaeota archaeon]